MTDEKLQEIKERWFGATPGPWRAGNRSSIVSDFKVPEISGSDTVNYYGGHLIGESIADYNIRFIAHAWEDIQTLILTVEVIQKENEKLRSELNVIKD